MNLRFFTPRFLLGHGDRALRSKRYIMCAVGGSTRHHQHRHHATLSRETPA